MKKIIVISNMYPSDEYPSFGIFVKNFVSVLNKEGFLVQMNMITKQDKFLRKLFSYVRLYVRLLWLGIISKKSDILYIHFPLYFVPVLLILTLFRKNLILNFHGSDAIFNTPIKKILFKALKRVVKSSHIVVPSDYYKELIVEEFKTNEKSILVYPSGGVDKSLFFPTKTEKKIFTLGYISNFIEIKGWKIFLEALNILKKTKPGINFKAMMVGSGPDKNQIMNTINNFDLEQVVSVNKPIPQDKLHKVYNSLDLFVFPTFRESLGLVGIEAMMCGIPVVASNIGGPNGYVKDGYNGFLFDIKNSEQLVSKILEYYYLSSDQKEMIKTSCLKTGLEFESQLVRKNLIQFLDSI